MVKLRRMRFLSGLLRGAPALVALSLASCRLDTATVDQGPLAGVKVINLLQGEDNTSIGFETGRPLAVIVFPSVAPTGGGSYFFSRAAINRQLRVLRTSSTVLDSTVLFTPNLYYTVVTLGVSGSTGRAAPRYLILTNNMSAVATGSVRFRFIHGASSVGGVDVHIISDSSTFSADSRLFENVTYGNAVTTEGRLADNRAVCVIAAGTVPVANGSNCSVLRFYGVQSGSVMTAALREPASTETRPDLLFSLDRTP
jgi:hypothetical protein